MPDQIYETASRLARTIVVFVVIILCLASTLAYFIVVRASAAKETQDAWCGTVDWGEPEMTIIPTTVFKQNCSACHRLTNESLVGPSLYGIFDRVPSEEWFDAFVTNEDTLIALGDPYTIKLNELYADDYRHRFGYLSPDDFIALKQSIKILK